MEPHPVLLVIPFITKENKYELEVEPWCTFTLTLIFSVYPHKFLILVLSPSYMYPSIKFIYTFGNIFFMYAHFKTSIWNLTCAFCTTIYTIYNFLLFCLYFCTIFLLQNIYSFYVIPGIIPNRFLRTNILFLYLLSLIYYLFLNPHTLIYNFSSYKIIIFSTLRYTKVSHNFSSASLEFFLKLVPNKEICHPFYI